MANWYIAPDGRWRTMMFKCNMFPLLDTYMKALTHEQNVKPVRGTNMKPIHLRSRKYMQIAVLPNEDVVYFDGWASSGEPVNDKDYIVKWKPNGEIHINAPMYNCVYEQLTSLLGVKFFRATNLLWVYMGDALPLRRYAGDTPTILKWVKNHDYPQYKRDYKLQYVNPPEVTQKAIDRGAAKTVRAKYKGIYDYLRAMPKIRNELYEYREFLEAFDIELSDRNFDEFWAIHRMMPKISIDYPLSQQDDIVELIGMANEGDLSASHKLWLMCAWAGGYRASWRGNNVYCSPNQLVKAFDNFILKLHREEVFYDKVVPRGKTPSTANNKFFN